MSIEQKIKSRWPDFNLERSLQIVVFSYQALAAIVLVLALFIASAWIKLPFLGAFFEPTLVKNAASPGQPDSVWPLHDLGVESGEQLIRVGGQSVHSSREVEQVLSRYFPGEDISVTLRSQEGITTTYNITLQLFPARDRNLNWSIREQNAP